MANPIDVNPANAGTAPAAAGDPSPTSKPPRSEIQEAHPRVPQDVADDGHAHAASFFATTRRFRQSLTEPVQSYESSGEDARRFALGICVVLAVAGYLFVEERSRRDRLADVVFYDHVLHAIDYVRTTPSLPEGPQTYIERFGVETSPILERVTAIHELARDTVSTVTGGVTRCEVEFYRASAHGGVVAGSDRDSTAWAFSGDHQDYLLLSFPSLCNVFTQDEPLFALIGKFSLAIDSKEYIPDKAEVAVIYEWHGDPPNGPRRTGSPPTLFHRSMADARNQLLRIAQNATGRYYIPDRYREAIAALSTSIQDAPTVMGVSLPPLITVLALPLVLCVLSFALYHRVRRLNNDKRAAWVLVTHAGLVETTVARIWTFVLVVAPVVVYLTSSLYLGAQPELRGDVQYIFDQNYSTERVTLLSVDLWAAGLRSPYVLSMCALSGILIVLSLVVLSKHASTCNSSSVAGWNFLLSLVQRRLRSHVADISKPAVLAVVIVGAVAGGLIIGGTLMPFMNGDRYRSSATRLEVVQLEPNQAFPDTLEAAERREWRYSGSAGTLVGVSAESESFDTVLRVISPSGEEIAWNDDGGDGTDSRLLMSLPRDGEYVIEVSSHSATTMGGAYTIAIAEGDGLETQSLEWNESTAGRIDPDGVELWRFVGKANRLVGVQVQSEDFDTVVRLLSPFGEEIGTDDDGGDDTNSFMVSTLPDDGHYLVEVEAFGASIGGSYDIRLEDGTLLEARPLEFARPAIDVIVSDGHGLWSFDGSRGQQIMVEARSAEFDTVVRLFSPSGVKIVDDDDGGEGTDSLLRINLQEEGRYRVLVTAFAGVDGGVYEVELREGSSQ